MRDVAGIAEALAGAESVCICSHVSPDGDTIGSALAMRLILQQMGRRSRLFCQDKVPDNLMFLPGAGEIRRPEENGDEKYDLFLSVDVSDIARLGECEKLMSRCSRSAQIDHHGTNHAFAEVNSIDGNASATCVMILEQMKAMGVKLTPEIAQCLYAGISTDTGNFSFDCTDAEAFRAMGDLREAGLPLAEINMVLFREKSRPQLLLLGRAIESLRFEGKDGRIAVMTLTRKDFEECGALSEHADTVVNFGLETTGTVMAVLGRENDDGRLKFSLRSRKPLTVDDVAARFGGGGHSQAAGISMEGSLQSATRTIVGAMDEKLRQRERKTQDRPAGNESGAEGSRSET